MKTIKSAALLGLLLAAGAAHAQKVPDNGAGAAQAPAAEPAADPAATTDAPAAAAGGMLSAADPQGVLTALQGLGHTGSLTTDGVGDPLIQAQTGDTQYEIYFYGCDANTNCQYFLFSAGYDLPNGSTLDVMNQWNASNLVGQAYLGQDNDPFINHFVTTVGGLSQANFADVIESWDVAVSDFEAAIGY
jgi:hypothetical protein